MFGIMPTAQRDLSWFFDMSLIRAEPFISYQNPSIRMLTSGSSVSQSTKNMPYYSSLLVFFKNFLKKGLAIFAGTMVNSEADDRIALNSSTLNSFKSPSSLTNLTPVGLTYQKNVLSSSIVLWVSSFM